MQTIGDRIKIRRKELNLTQMDLAEKLNVTDRAVSKWEQGDGNPDFSLLASLSEVLSVSLDYLIAGKEPEVNLEDMDAVKRAIYLAKKDDMENFQKYGCFDDTLFFDKESRKIIFPHSANATQLENLRKTIVENKSIKIFSLMLDSFVKFCTDRRNESIMKCVFSGAYFVKSYLDDFVLMTCELGRIDVLKLIRFEWFNSYIGGEIQFSPRKDGRDSQFELFSISEKTIKSILSNPNTTAEIVDYFCAPVFLLQLGGNEMHGTISAIPVVGNLVNSVLSCLCELNDRAHIDKIMESLYKNLRENTKTYVSYDIRDDMRQGYRNVTKRYLNGVCFSHKSADSYYNYYNYYAAVPLIKSAFEKAKSNYNLDMVKLFNDYNKEVANTLGAEIRYMNDEEIRLFAIRCNPNSSATDKVLASYSKYGILDYSSLFSTVDDSLDDVSALKKSISSLKSIYEKYVKDSCICFMELIEKYIQDKDYRSLFKFVTDYKISPLEESVLSANDSDILEKAKEIFTPSPDFYSKIEILNAELANMKLCRSSNTWSKINEISALVDSLTSTKTEPLGDMLKWQYKILSYKSFNGITDYVEYCAKLKKDYLDSKVKKLEERIETITLEQKHKADYDRVSSEITFDYLRAELAKGNEDTVVIKLCVLLEATLIYKYKYEGDLFAMVDKYVSSHYAIRELHSCYDDEDNNYYDYQREDEKIKEENAQNTMNTQLLHKLRMNRNSLVHAEGSPISMSVEDLEKCISIVESM